MRTTIDKAGPLAIPKPLRHQLGLRPGQVDVVADGTGPRRVTSVHEPQQGLVERLSRSGIAGGAV